MKSWFKTAALMVFALTCLPNISPAPLIYTPGEGWVYQAVGATGDWRKTRAKDQLEVAQQAFDRYDYDGAIRAAKYTLQQWPLADYAPRAQYLIGRCYEAQGKDEKAFDEYQKLVEKYPKIDNYQEVLQRQYEIANRFMGGQWFKQWGVIPYKSKDKTVEMYEKIVKNGPYSEVAPQAQFKVGAIREKQEEFEKAVKVYEATADKYNDQKIVAADALYKSGMAHYRQARTAEYDQAAAGKAVTSFNDFLTLYPEDPRCKEARRVIDALRYEQAQGAMKIAKFYDNKKQVQAALVYYNEVLLKDPNSSFAMEARQRIDAIRASTGIQGVPANPGNTNAGPVVPSPVPAASSPRK
jgi:outer membrane protein assembly factor BamD